MPEVLSYIPSSASAWQGGCTPVISALARRGRKTRSPKVFQGYIGSSTAIGDSGDLSFLKKKKGRGYCICKLLANTEPVSSSALRQFTLLLTAGHMSSWLLNPTEMTFRKPGRRCVHNILCHIGETELRKLQSYEKCVMICKWKCSQKIRGFKTFGPQTAHIILEDHSSSKEVRAEEMDCW